MPFHTCIECGQTAINLAVFGVPAGPYCNDHDKQERRKVIAMLQQAIDPAHSFFAACVAAGVEIDHHESDLYVPVSDVTRALLKRFALKASAFTSQIDGRLWYDVPFAYLPWWQSKQRLSGQLQASPPKE